MKLAEVLDSLAQQLLEAQSNATERGAAVMQFAECEIEFAVEIEKTAQAGIQIYVLKFGGDVKRADSNTIRLKFSALPNSAVQAMLMTENESTPIERHKPKKTGKGSKG